MDKLQKQIQELQEKVDKLHSLVERIDSQMNNLTTEKTNTAEANYSFPPIASPRNRVSAQKGEDLYSMSHKDILVDDDSNSSNTIAGSEKELSPDIQIRRLTAQLTAAYNRIAALEEQLLSSRIHF